MKRGNSVKKALTITVIGVLTVMTIWILSRTLEGVDVVGKDSARAFNELLQKAPQLVAEDKDLGAWSIVAPDSGARFNWRWEHTAQANDVVMEIDAAPFIAAGLDTSKLPEAIAYNGGKLAIGTKLVPEGSAAKAKAKSTPLAAYECIVNLNRDAVGYHAALDHYGIKIGGGNMFEWAKNINTNDKGMVFVLNPEPFINAGVTPDKIDGWAFAKVTVDDENGKPVQVDKILKPFNFN
ncbi:hypothetical protein R80B4_01365 [Fibrobacteres bacterium R8-0-B4]